MSSKHPDVVSVIRSWLETSSEKVGSFWIGAEWRPWARFELFMALEKTLGKDCLITHSNNDFWQKDTEEVDILIEPRDGDTDCVAIVLRCEKVNENEGSFERFAGQYREDWERLTKLKTAGGDFDGAKLLLLGLSGQPAGDEEGEFKLDPIPDHFNSGEVHGWVKQYTCS